MKFTLALFNWLGGAMLLGAVGALAWSTTQAGFFAAAMLPMIVTLGITGGAFLIAGRYMRGLDMSGTIANGVPATAQILSVQDTGVTINNLSMVVKLKLLVTVPGAPAYEAETRTMLSGRTQWGALQPGMTIPVKVDPTNPSKVAVDVERGLSADEAPPEMLAQAVNQALSAGPAGGQQAGMISMKAADIIAAGVKAEGTLVSVTPTGLTADRAAAGLTPEQADDPLVVIVLSFTDEVGKEHHTRAVVRVPDGKAAFLAAGVQVPIAYLAGKPDTATIDWTRLGSVP